MLASQYTKLNNPFPTINTPWTEMPREFLHYVLPHIHWEGWNGCWVWVGGMMPDGTPILTIRENGKNRRYSCRRWVYSRWKTPPGKLSMNCGRINCLNPNHMVADKKVIYDV